jgi:hypothetical protein
MPISAFAFVRGGVIVVHLVYNYHYSCQSPNNKKPFRKVKAAFASEKSELKAVGIVGVGTGLKTISFTIRFPLEVPRKAIVFQNMKEKKKKRS